MFLTKLELNVKSRKTADWLRNPYNVHKDLWKAFPSDPAQKQEAPFLYRFDLNRNETSIQPRILVFSKIKPDWNDAFADRPVLLGIPQVKDNIDPNSFIQEGAIFRFSLIANPTKKILNYRALFEEELKDYPKEYSRAKHKEYMVGKRKLEELVAALPQEKKDSFRLEKKKKQLKNMKKVGIYEEQEQIEWLKRQGNNPRSADYSAGFELIQTEVKNQKGETDYWNSAFTHGQEISRFQITQKKDEAGIIHDIKIHTVAFSGVLRVTNPGDFKRAYAQGIGSGKAFGCGMLLLARV
ncbi:CRISPR-associated protein Cas6/Cse3/CasE, subtype TIGR01907-like protein [Leptospira weilii serovar Ranarum str. ICFT]|uniref:CRISPR-associated protein Cas6/Cse3/CasE, subtype TIGR01907-like protein n=1 Tax=Leptospira weilii serovar Ranarum str. ICFT TaxID=1218598 RepID=N1WLJ4_9LEPT|nr:type I-E CRISPR-associated protein Cas6/Cse3/CasE [Leptospira weilii]EMY78014.1 CRISPR-associated protein Cas6/Cse3/CasE, subtype TIGR01907-like protein [Leptospira weilii serovar Ranarum str. ICFT]